MNQDNILKDSFLVKHLDPAFLETLNGYWHSLINAQVSEEEKIQIREALYNLVRFAFRNLFKKLYEQHTPFVKGKIFLLSAVHNDGIGDFIATLKCARLLKEQHPALDVHVAYTHKQKLPTIDPTFYQLSPQNLHDFQETNDSISQILGTVLEEKPLIPVEEKLAALQLERDKIQSEYGNLQSDFPQAAEAVKDLALEIEKPIKQLLYYKNKRHEAEEIYSQMKDSVAIIHISLALNTFDNPHLAKKSLYFAEAGNFQGIGNYLQRNWFSMGIDSFEEGIFLHKDAESSKWLNIKFSQYLWKTPQPSQEQLNVYFKTHSLHLGYLPRVEDQKNLFVEIICRHCIQDDRHIDIVLPKITAEDLNEYNRDWMVSYGISKVLFVEESTNLKEIVVTEIDLPVQKILRLICCLPLPTSDFIKMMGLSGDLVGCTGDGSLSDCMAIGKIPFYEVRPHKIRTVQAFKHLARKLTLPDVIEYFELLEQFTDWPAQSFAIKFEQILYSDAFKAQWNQLSDSIKQFYCFENSFTAQINRHLYLSVAPDIKEKEEFLIQNFFEGQINAEKAYEMMEHILKNHELTP